MRRSALLAVLLGLVAALPCSAADPAAPLPRRVLFIGNSYTSVNNLPGIFQEIVASAGQRAPAIAAVTPGGATLDQQRKLPETLAIIDRGGWDVVVVQGQSLEAAFAEQYASARASFLAGAVGLYDRIKARSPAATVVLYETWARHGDYWKDPKADQTLGRSPADMQSRIRKWYAAAAQEISTRRGAGRTHDVVVAPVGDAWERNYRDPDPIRLHVSDGSHPNFAGSYLAGLVIYAAVYHPADLAIAWHGALSQSEAARLQQIAMRVRQPRRAEP